MDRKEQKSKDKTTRILEYLGMRCAAYERRMCFKCNEQWNARCSLAGQQAFARQELGARASQDEYIRFFAKRLATEHYILHLKYGYDVDSDCFMEGQVQKAIKAVEAGHNGMEDFKRYPLLP